MQQSDRDCVRLCLDGRPEAFRQLVERYERPVISYLAGRLRDSELAAEIAQEAFVRSFCSLGSLKKPEAFFPWLCGIAQRVLKETARRKTRETHFEAPSSVPDEGTSQPRHDFDLEAAVAALGEPYRDVVLLRFYGGLSCREVAARLGVPLGTVTKRLSRAYQMLRETLKSPSRNVEVDG